MRTPSSVRPTTSDTAVRQTGVPGRVSSGAPDSAGSGATSAAGGCTLGRLEHFDHPECAGAAGERLCAGEDALHEVPGGERERLDRGGNLERVRREPRDRDDRGRI